MKIKSHEDLGLSQDDYYQSKFVLDDGKTIITSLPKEDAGAFHVFGNREQTRLTLLTCLVFLRVRFLVL